MRFLGASAWQVDGLPAVCVGVPFDPAKLQAEGLQPLSAKPKGPMPAAYETLHESVCSELSDCPKNNNRKDAGNQICTTALTGGCRLPQSHMASMAKAQRQECYTDRLGQELGHVSVVTDPLCNHCWYCDSAIK